jgi:lysyl-tRNA synthetase class II
MLLPKKYPSLEEKELRRRKRYLDLLQRCAEGLRSW